MSLVFILIAAVTALSAVAAMSLRNLVHCALCAALTFGGLAALFLQLGAQFVGLAQILVYVGAVAILIVGYASTFFVHQSQNAVVVRFGRLIDPIW